MIENQEMLDLINSLSDKIRDMLVNYNEDGEPESINGAQFTNAFEASRDLNEQDAITELFLRQKCETDWSNIGWNKLEPLSSVLKKICNEVGYKESANPFLVFVKEYFPNGNMTQRDFIQLNNLYANEDIDYEDLINQGDIKTIFNRTLYKDSNWPEIVKVEKWLSNPKNLNKMNWEEVANANGLSDKVKGIANQILELQKQGKTINSVEEADVYKNGILYKDDENLNSYQTIKNILDLASRQERGSEKPDSKESSKPSEESPENLKKAIIDGVRKNYGSLSKEELKSVLADLAKEWRL